jgi:hypothetical protein
MSKEMREQIDNFKNSLLKENNGNSFEDNRKTLRKYIKTILNSEEYRDGYRMDDGGWDDDSYKRKYNIYDFWVRYLTIIHNSLLIEERFENEFKISGKEINKFLNLKNTNDFSEIIELCNNYYDSNNKVRFGIETKDSIEEVRNYIKTLEKNGIKFYDKIYFKFNK